MKSQIKTKSCPECGEQHSKGARAAAKVIMSGKRALATEWGNKTECGVAAIIDNCTHAPALAEALNAVLKTCQDGVIHRTETGKPQWSAFEHMSTIARAALAKIGGAS